MKNIKIVVQARLNSSRFKNKILQEINKISLIEILLRRLSKSKYSNNVLVATSTQKSDDKLVSKLKYLKTNYYRGEENDVLSRIYKSLEKSKPDIVVRITSDCPLLDYRIMDNMLEHFIQKFNKIDYLSNTIDVKYPDGQDIEIFKFNALKKAFKNASSFFEREHPTQYILNKNDFIKENYNSLKADHSNIRITVDYKEDLYLIKKIINYFHPNLYFSLNDIIKYLKSNKNLLKINLKHIRNNGFKSNEGQKLFERAKKIIPNGTMLLSKNPDLFLPGKWPTYFSKTRGCEIWDLENKKYIDMSYMGVGTNILGYSNRIVDNEVRKIITKGNLSTLNCPEEVYLSEKLLEINPWASKVRFTRTGGEANAVAIRIARTATENQSIAVCGYHGWHDWYLAANLKKRNELSNFIIPGLKTKGVPKELSNSIFTFNYNDFEHLERLINEKKIGIVKMEVSRSEKPKNNFLKKVRDITKKNNIILIFDECTSGFRETYGGLFLKYKVIPDLAIFGKALGNGYAINAIVGNDITMNSAKETFISSTFWTERIGSVAALKTLELMKDMKSWEIISKQGKKIKKRWKKIFSKNKISANINGIEPLPSFIFNCNDHQKYKTYITQYFLEKNFLVTNSIYVSTAHTKEKIDEYFYYFDKVIKDISDCENGERSIDKLLKFPVSISKFGRLN